MKVNEGEVPQYYMTYKEIKELVAGKELPCGGTNDEGEAVIIEHGIDYGVG